MSKLAITPSDLGLPSKFSAFRGREGKVPGQFEIATEIAASDKRFSLLSAPPGTGKTLIYSTVSKILDVRRTLILVGTKSLQDQISADGLADGDMRGLSSYRCVAVDRQLKEYGRSGASCAEGPCRVGVFCSYKKEGGCLYYDAQADARDASVVVTSYAYWLTLGRHADPSALGEFDLIVLDEAHEAANWLTDFCTVTLERSVVRFLLDLDLPPIDEGVDIWADWARHAHLVAIERAAETRKSLENSKLTVAKRDITDRLLKLNDLARGLGELSKAGKWKPSTGGKTLVQQPGQHTDWVVEPWNRHRRTTGKSDGIKFSPVWAHAYASSMLFRGISRVLLVSATLDPIVADHLGIPAPDYDYFALPSAFDPKRRPLIYIPTTRVDRSMTDGQFTLLVRQIDDIIGARQDRKGIIHCRSYEYGRRLQQRSKYRDLFLTHDSQSTRETIARFKSAAAPAVLVSPSVEAGVDFPDDECRYQIILKVPFIDGSNPVTKERARSDKRYLNYVAALSLVQMVGRGMRSKRDLCESFILDDHWRWFKDTAHFAPWFKAAWRWLDKSPPPLPLT